jgi:hypothetical protein
MAGRPASRVRGPGEARFREAPGPGERCRAAVEELRRPDGFVCPLCGGAEGEWLGTRPKVQCRARRHQVSLTAGTIFDAADRPVPGHVADRGRQERDRRGRRLGVEGTNAWALKRKIVAVMAGREDRKRLDGRVGMDDACLGGHRPGERGRGAAGKRPFVAAVSTGDARRPREIEPLPVKGFRKNGVERLVGGHPASASRPVTDGLGCWTAAAGLRRTAMVTGGERAAGRSPCRRASATPGDVEAAIVGTCRRVGPGHAGRHLGSFARRHHRRFRLDGPIPRPVHGAVRAAPPPCAKLVAS